MDIDSRTHFRIYQVAAVLCLFGAFATLELRSIGREVPLRFPNLNGLGYYMYLPSLIIDGDLDFENQARAALGREGPSWVVSGRYPLGVAFTLAPSFILANGFSRILYWATGSPVFEPDGFSALYALFNVSAIVLIWTIAMGLMDRLLRRRFGMSRISAVSATLLFWFGSYAIWYVIRAPFWGHVLSTAWLVIALSVFDRVLRDADRGEVTFHLPWLAFVMSLAVTCRLSNLFMAPFAFYLVVHFTRTGVWKEVARKLPGLLVALTPVLLQVLVWQPSGGESVASVPSSPEQIGYEAKERFYWTQPVLLLPLFSSLQGLFFYSPVLLWSMWGLAWGVAKRDLWRDPLFACLGVSALVLWYVNGAWYAWWFGGDAFGARAFLELGGLFMIGFALAVEHLGQCSPRTRASIAAAVAAALLVGYGLMAARAMDRLPSKTRSFLFEWERELFSDSTTRGGDARIETESL